MCLNLVEGFFSTIDCALTKELGCQELTVTQISESVTSMFSLTNMVTEIHKKQKDELEMSFMTHSETELTRMKAELLHSRTGFLEKKTIDLLVQGFYRAYNKNWAETQRL